MKKISYFFTKNEKWLIPTALFGGFILDNFTLRQVDALFENIFIGLYFILLMGALLVWHNIEYKARKSVALIEFQSIIFLFIQFLFGGLFSALTVFYIKSASFFASWPFLIILFGGMIAVEYFKKHFNQFLIQISALYFLLFTYTIVLIPLFLRSINQIIFVMSGVVSLLLISGYVFVFKQLIPNFFINRNIKVYSVLGGIYLCMNIFYFANIIPPIPLALKESGVYKSVTKNNSDYNFTSFNSNFSFVQFKKEYEVTSGSSVYFYSSVFAPIRFNQTIVHEWSQKNREGKWIVISRIPFQIEGGSDRGYRGYTVSTRVTKGEWRVLVKTSTGQVLGGETFIVK